MTKLRDHIAGLERWLAQYTPPAWDEIRIVELASSEIGAPSLALPASRLQSVDSFEPRFEALLSAGYTWINFRCYGIVSRKLFLMIELPPSGPAASVAEPNVVYGGPALSRDGRPAWAYDITLIDG